MNQHSAPKYSILVPAYKAKYLDECIRSVLNQDYGDLELIILNDCSPEDIDSIVGKYSDSRIRYYKNSENKGAVKVVDNWNKLLELSHGEYVLCIGDDDCLKPNCTSEYNKLIDKHKGLAVYHGWTEIIDENSIVTAIQQARPEFESVYSLIWHRWNGRDQFIGDFLFEAATLKADGGFINIPMAWGSDDMTAFRAACRGGIASTSTTVFQYRRSAMTITSVGDPEVKLMAVDVYEKLAGELLREPAPDSTADIDLVFRQMCLERHPVIFAKKRMQEVCNDMLRNGLAKGLFRWMKRKRRYKLSNGIIFGACFEAKKAKRKLSIRIKK